jgi:hypothetical protein
VLLVVGWQCLLSVSDVCSLRDTSGCLRGWPLMPIPHNVHKYYNLELGWYLHLMLKHPLGAPLAGSGVWAPRARAPQRRQAWCGVGCGRDVAWTKRLPASCCARCSTPRRLTHDTHAHTNTHARMHPGNAGLGLQDGGTMGVHHLATVALIVLSYMLSVHYLGACVLLCRAQCGAVRHAVCMGRRLCMCVCVCVHVCVCVCAWRARAQPRRACSVRACSLEHGWRHPTCVRVCRRAQCAGMLVFCSLNVSNPLLHASKLASVFEMRRTKTALFGLFAAVFFVTRVLLFPYVIIKA